MSKSQELKAKLDKALEKVEKTKKTIERHKVQAEKKLAIVKAGGWDENDRYCRQNTPDHHDAYWAICEYQGKLDDIKGAEKKLADAERIANGWADKYKEAVKFENKIAWELPEIFIHLKDDLADQWTEDDIRRRENMLKKRRELSWEDFRKIWSYNDEERINISDDKIRKSNERDAELFVLDLYNRVKAETGEVTDWGNIYYDGNKALNGWVSGKDGKVSVESILAGGYNIQRLHVRVLVKRIG